MEELNNTPSQEKNNTEKISFQDQLHQDQIALDRLGASVHLHPEADPQFINFAQAVLRSYNSTRKELIDAYHDADDNLLDMKIDQLKPIVESLESDPANDGSLDSALEAIKDLFHNIPTE